MRPLRETKTTFFCRGHQLDLDKGLFNSSSLRFRRHLCKICLKAASQTKYKIDPMQYLSSEIRRKVAATLSRSEIEDVLAAHRHRCFLSDATGVPLILIRTGENGDDPELGFVPAMRRLARQHGFMLPLASRERFLQFKAAVLRDRASSAAQGPPPPPLPPPAAPVSAAQLRLLGAEPPPGCGTGMIGVQFMPAALAAALKSPAMKAILLKRQLGGGSKAANNMKPS